MTSLKNSKYFAGKVGKSIGVKFFGDQILLKKLNIWILPLKKCETALKNKVSYMKKNVLEYFSKTILARNKDGQT